MDKKKYLEKIKKNLVNDDLKINLSKINGIDVLTGFKKKFKWLWFATQLKIFVYAGYSNKISKSVITSFSKSAIEKSIKEQKGLPRGFQSGLVSFTLLYSSNIDKDAIEWIQQPPPKHFAAFEIPVLYDLKKDKLYYYSKTPIWGLMYYGFFRKFIQKSFE